MLEYFYINYISTCFQLKGVGSSPFLNLAEIDENMLLFFNGMHSSWLDPIVMAFTGKAIWIPMYIAIASLIVWKFGWKRGLIIIVAIGLAVGCADLIAARLIRPYFARLRPANLENPINVLVHIVDGYRGGRYGFPSCHAANTFALAVSSSMFLKIRWYTIAIFIWALLQCYSRIYLGVHYPGDILAGAIVGTAFALIMYCAAKYLLNHIKDKPKKLG